MFMVCARAAGDGVYAVMCLYSCYVAARLVVVYGVTWAYSSGLLLSRMPSRAPTPLDDKASS